MIFDSRFSESAIVTEMIRIIKFRAPTVPLFDLLLKSGTVNELEKYKLETIELGIHEFQRHKEQSSSVPTV